MRLNIIKYLNKYYLRDTKPAVSFVQIQIYMSHSLGHQVTNTPLSFLNNIIPFDFLKTNIYVHFLSVIVAKEENTI